ncbi:MAG: alpha/beta hydrolase, partial [Planctomycetaceae bacterium]|nr:alpha/beta hydrolase [Planctomycetaceae bacterium]
GGRDAFGTPEEVVGYVLSDAIRFEWLADGDHSFKPRKKSGRTLEENLARAVACFADFVEAM